MLAQVAVANDIVVDGDIVIDAAHAMATTAHRMVQAIGGELGIDENQSRATRSPTRHRPHDGPAQLHEAE